MKRRKGTVVCSSVCAALLTIAAFVFTAGPVRATQPSNMTTELILSPLAGGKSTFDEIDINAKTDRNSIPPADGHLPPDFWKAQINTKGGASELYVVRNTFTPAGTTVPSTGWHTHPGPSLVTVTQGTITVYDGDDPTCTPHVYSAGSTFIDPTSNNHTHLVRNETGTPAITVAVQLVPAGVARRIDSPNPGLCPSIN